jgi:predicted DNA-binding transcriptional regulator AlpA
MVSQMPTNTKPKLSTKRAAKAAGVSRITLLRWVRDGKVRGPKPVLIGAVGMRLWSPADVERIRAWKAKHFCKGRGRKKQAKKGD